METAKPQQHRLNLHDYEVAARAALPSTVFEFIAGGSGDEVTLRASRSSFDRWRLLPRMLRGHRETSTATSVLGQEVSLPVLIAPFAAHKLCHRDGERATARAAKAARTIFTLATPSTTAMEEVAPEAGRWWFQLFVFRDRGHTRELVARAVAAGASALVVTADMPVFGWREADERNRFALPPGMAFVHMPKPPARADASTGSAVAGAVNAVFERQGLEDVGRTPNAAVNKHFDPSRNGVHDVWKSIECRYRAVELATAMVGYGDCSGTVVDGSHRIVRMQDAFRDHGKL